MENNEITDLLNDLIRINGDRVEGYEKAAKEVSADNPDLKSFFEKNAKLSRQYYGDLSSLVVSQHGRPSSGTTSAGKVYRVWMDVRSALSKQADMSVLASCEYGEDAAQKAYQQVLDSDVTLPDAVREIVVNEQKALKAAHDEVKKYRDQYDTVNDKH